MWRRCTEVASHQRLFHSYHYYYPNQSHPPHPSSPIPPPLSPFIQQTHSRIMDPSHLISTSSYRPVGHERRQKSETKTGDTSKHKAVKRKRHKQPRTKSRERRKQERREAIHACSIPCPSVIQPDMHAGARGRVRFLSCVPPSSQAMVISFFYFLRLHTNSLVSVVTSRETSAFF